MSRRGGGEAEAKESEHRDVANHTGARAAPHLFSDPSPEAVRLVHAAAAEAEPALDRREDRCVEWATDVAVQDVHHRATARIPGYPALPMHPAEVRRIVTLQTPLS